MPKERWKVIDGHPNYEVSNLGKVRNIKTNRLLTPYDDGKGYLRVKIDGKCLRLHILVAVSFLPNTDNKPTVNHIHGNKHDNRASQLEWGDLFRTNAARLGYGLAVKEKLWQTKSRIAIST